MSQRAFLLAPLMAAFMATRVFAEDHSQHAMPTPVVEDHSMHGGKSDPLPEEPEPPATDGHDHAAMSHDAHSPGAIPLTPMPAITDADRAAAWAPLQEHAMHGNALQSLVLFNRLEGFDGENGDGLEWEGQAWFGSDLNKLWLRSEGERRSGAFESGDLEVLYGRAFARWWDGLIGIRHDFKPGESRDFIAIGVSGVAPYKFEVEATVYLGPSGQTAARLEIEYETLLTNRWILQPLVELNAHGRDDPHRGVGSGLGTAEAGLRLRYEISRQFAPYIGITRERAFGKTADLRRTNGESRDDTRIVAGVRLWF
jgi:copper resistance protein B